MHSRNSVVPQHNYFRHQPYPTVPGITPTRHVLNVRPEPTDFARLHTQHCVRKVILVPGTFAGNDPVNVSGTLNALADRLPTGGAVFRHLADRISEKTQASFRSLAEDVGHYTPSYSQRFEDLTGGDPRVEILNPTWTGQNHHFARADLAVRLLDHLDRLDLFHKEKILLWGHSHAGSGFALLSNLLANDRESIDRFFEASGHPQDSQWLRAHRTLISNPSPHPLARHVSAVTFGAPVRYGWDTNGLSAIYHVLFDRANRHGSRFTTRPMFPPHPIGEMLNAAHGDWVQAFAIAGTDVVPPAPGPIERNKRLAELLLNGLEPAPETIDTRLIPSQQLRQLCARWKLGTRCHEDGHNLLVDYRPSGRIVRSRPVECSIFGHGVATTIDWLPAHLALLLKQMDIAAAA